MVSMYDLGLVLGLGPQTMALLQPLLLPKRPISAICGHCEAKKCVTVVTLSGYGKIFLPQR
jgi:hypothetical protein